MKKWMVSDVRWATSGDLDLPFWQKWNSENKLPQGFWQRIWEYPYAALHIPRDASVVDIGGTYPFVLFPNWGKAVSVDNRNLNKLDHPLLHGQWPKGKLIISDAAKVPAKDNSYDYAMSISAIEEMPNTVKVLKEMIRLAKHRVVVTMDVSEELGVNRPLLRELESFLGITLPTIPRDVLRSNDEKIETYGQTPIAGYQHIRVLGIVIDTIDIPKDVGILIPHWESYAFIDACLQGVQKQQHKNIHPHVYILDDNSQDGSFQKLRRQYGRKKDITLIKVVRKDQKKSPDVGYVLDEGLKHVTEQFVAMIDADTIPLSKDWLAFPIWLLEKYHASSVGLDTGLSASYAHMGDMASTWWQPAGGYSIRGGLYDNNWFTVTNNLYRVMRTATAKVVSQSVGFTRGRERVWYKRFATRFLKMNTRPPYLPVGCDNGVAANHFIDVNRMGPKFNLPLTSYIGLTAHDGAYGQNISGLLFHFALSTRALSNIRREVWNTGEGYRSWVTAIAEKGVIDQDLARKMIAASGKFKPGGYDGSVPKSWYTTEYKYVQTLLGEFRRSQRK